MIKIILLLKNIDISKFLIYNIHWRLYQVRPIHIYSPPPCLWFYGNMCCCTEEDKASALALLLCFLMVWTLKAFLVLQVLSHRGH